MWLICTIFDITYVLSLVALITCKHVCIPNITGLIWKCVKSLFCVLYLSLLDNRQSSYGCIILSIHTFRNITEQQIALITLWLKSFLSSDQSKAEKWNMEGGGGSWIWLHQIFSKLLFEILLVYSIIRRPQPTYILTIKIWQLT